LSQRQQQANIAETMNAVDEVLGAEPGGSVRERAAVIYGDRSLTYTQLHALINRYGNALIAAGVGREDRVMFLLDDSPELVAAYLATIKIGGVAVAYNVRAAAEDLLFTINDSRCRLLFIEQQFLPLYRDIESRLQFDVQLVIAGYPETGAMVEAEARSRTIDDFSAGHAAQLDSTPMSPDDMAFWIYTSGTTGKPKAAVHLHHDVLLADRHLRENLGVRPGDRILSSSKLFFAYSLGHLLLGGLRAGATMVLFQGWPEAAGVAALVERHRPDYFFSVPTFYRNLLRGGHAGGASFRAVRHFISAGEGLPKALFEQWQEVTGKPILEGIGTSESIFLFIANTPSSHRPGSCGRPLPWAKVRLLDESERPVTEPGHPGILWLRMPSVCDRYWNRQDQSRSSFHGYWYCTGDVFTCDADGWWYHQGRADNMLKISGQWVSPVEIENCALEVTGVVDAAVVGVANADGLVRAALFVVPEAKDFDPGALQQAIQRQLKRCLSIYKCPREVRFIADIPRTATGKMQKYKLRQLLEQECGHSYNNG